VKIEEELRKTKSQDEPEASTLSEQVVRAAALKNVLEEINDERSKGNTVNLETWKKLRAAAIDCGRNDLLFQALLEIADTLYQRQDKSNYLAALPYFEELERIEKFPGMDEMNLAVSMNNFGAMLMELELMDRAIPPLKKAAQYFEAYHKETRESKDLHKFLSLLGHLVKCFVATKDMDRAGKALARIEKYCPPELEDPYLVPTRIMVRTGLWSLPQLKLMRKP